MINIDTGDSDKYFKIDGYNYRKGLYEIYYTLQGDAVENRIGIRHINKNETLLSPIPPDEFVINGQGYSLDTIQELMTDLAEILGFNTGTGGGGTSGIRTIITDEPEYELSPEVRTTILTFTGGASTLILPPKEQTVDLIVILTNAGTGELTITSPDGVWEGGMVVESSVMETGTTARIVNDGINYRINS